LFAIAYVAGLLVVNLYYNRFGVYSLTLFRLNYVIAGVWAFLPVLLSFLAILSILGFAYYFETPRKLLLKLAKWAFKEQVLIDPNHPSFSSDEQTGSRFGLFIILMCGGFGILFVYFPLNIHFTKLQWANLFAGSLTIVIATIYLLLIPF
jgi:hypothetical protein